MDEELLMTLGALLAVLMADRASAEASQLWDEVTERLGLYVGWRMLVYRDLALWPAWPLWEG